MKKILSLSIIFVLAIQNFTAQEESNLSNIQEFTPSKLLKKGQWDIKTFLSFYTQTRQSDSRSDTRSVDRLSFLTSTNEIFTGVSNNSRVNIGFVFQFVSSQEGGNNLYDGLGVFRLKNDRLDTRFGLTTIAPSIRIQPFKNVANFSLTSSFFIPVFEDTPTLTGRIEADGGTERTPFLSQKSFAWETKFFYDKTFGGNKWQVFTEADFKFYFGEDSSEVNEANENADERFANESLSLPLSVFLSYFPSSKSTVFINLQQRFLIDLGNEFEQNSTAWGVGAKYQLTNVFNVEVSFSDIFRGVNFQGVGETYSVGVRALF